MCKSSCLTACLRSLSDGMGRTGVSIRHKHSHIYNISMCMCECVFVCCCLRAYKFIAKTFDAAERTFHIKTSSFCPAASAQVGRARASAVAACMFVCVCRCMCTYVCYGCALGGASHEYASQARTHTHTHNRTLHFRTPRYPFPVAETYVQHVYERVRVCI